MEEKIDSWDKYFYNFGRVKENTSVEMSFTYQGNKEINNIRPSCRGCTKIKSFENNILTVSFKDTIPLHLSKDREQSILKSIFINYSDGTQDILRFSGKIYKT